MKHIWKITRLGLGFIFFVLVWAFVIGFSSNQPGSFFNKGNNAIWIGHEWVGDYKSDSEIQALATNLQKYQFHTVFVHVGPLKEDGKIDPETHKYSIDFVEKFKKFNKDIELQAWLGQVRGKIDLGDVETRHNVVNQAMIMAQLVGFDGVHFDIEPVWDKDLDFIQLLKESRETLSEDKSISVALAEFIPESLIWMLDGVYEFKNYNSQVNYKNVAQYADQIVVMVYDTGINSEKMYKWLVQEQTIWLSSLLKGKELFVGIPAYDEEKKGFNPKVENVKNGLHGIINGLNNLRSNEETFAGVAIYPYWEIDEEEWQTYENLWLK